MVPVDLGTIYSLNRAPEASAVVPQAPWAAVLAWASVEPSLPTHQLHMLRLMAIHPSFRLLGGLADMEVVVEEGPF